MEGAMYGADIVRFPVPDQLDLAFFLKKKETLALREQLPSLDQLDEVRFSSAVRSW